MASCNSWQYLVTILAKNFPRSWQDLAKILLRYPWRVDPGNLFRFRKVFGGSFSALSNFFPFLFVFFHVFSLKKNASKRKLLWDYCDTAQLFVRIVSNNVFIFIIFSRQEVHFFAKKTTTSMQLHTWKRNKT